LATVVAQPESSAENQGVDLMTLGVQSRHKNMRWFSKRVNVPSDRAL
jgi:hypothetical protein